MGKIVISEFVSVDGVVQDPTGEEGFTRGGWFFEVADKDRDARTELMLEEALGADAFLFGRRTYEFLAARWPSRSGELADRLNSVRKYVVSSALEDLAWDNSAVVNGDAVSEAAKLRQELDRDIIVPGSLQLARSLIEHDLVDELRLIVHPVVLGDGARLFDATANKRGLRRLETRAVGDSLAFLAYGLSPGPDPGA